jgi:hypothetical protein
MPVSTKSEWPTNASQQSTCRHQEGKRVSVQLRIQALPIHLLLPSGAAVLRQRRAELSQVAGTGQVERIRTVRSAAATADSNARSACKSRHRRARGRNRLRSFSSSRPPRPLPLPLPSHRRDRASPKRQTRRSRRATARVRELVNRGHPHAAQKGMSCLYCSDPSSYTGFVCRAGVVYRF